MAKITPRKLKTADYKPEEQELIEKLGRVLNPLFDELEAAFRKGISVEDNLPFAYRTVELQVDALGIPTTAISLSNPFTSGFQGFIVVNVQDMNGTAIRPTATPFITFEIADKAIQLKQISGLPATSKFRLFLLLCA